MSEVKVDRKFEFVQLKDDIKDQKFENEAISFFKDAMLRFKKNKASITATVFICIIVFMALFGPMMSSYSYLEQHTEWAYLPPRIQGLEKIGICDGSKVVKVQKKNIEKNYKDSVIKTVREYKERNVEMADIKVNMYKIKGAEGKYFWFGTDCLGRSQWTRLWRGSRISLLIAVISVLVNVFIGVLIGSVCGYYGGKVDMIIQRIIEVISYIPQIVLIILFIVYVGFGIVPIIMSLLLTGWIGTSYMIRAQFYRYKGQEYVLASRTMGAKDSVLIFRHILPNAIGPTITSASLAIPGAIFYEASLAYLGLGLPAPEPSIGVLLNEGQQVLLTNPHLVVFPAIVISVLMISFNLFGNGLRDAFDPTLRGFE